MPETPLISIGNRETSFTELTDNTSTTCYSTATGYRAIYVTEIRCTQNQGFTGWVTVTASQSGTTRTLCYRKTIPANCWFSMSFDVLALKNGDSISAAGSRSGIEVMVNFAPVAGGNR